MVESLENILYDVYGISLPESVLGNPDLQIQLLEQAKRLIPRMEFDASFKDNSGLIRRGGGEWKVIQAETNSGFGLIPPEEYYRINFAQKQAGMVPEFAVMKGGLVTAAFQWDTFEGKPWLRLLDISIPGFLRNKTRFKRSDENPYYFRPYRFGLNLNYTNTQNPHDSPGALPYPRLVYDFNESKLRTQLNQLPVDSRIGDFFVGNGGQQIRFSGKAHKTIPSIFLNIDLSMTDYLISATSGDTTVGVYLKVPLSIEDPGFIANPNLRNYDDWVNSISEIVLPMYA